MTTDARVENLESLLEDVQDLLTDIDAEFLCDELDKAGVPVAIVNSLDEIHEDPQVIQQESWSSRASSCWQNAYAETSF